MFSAQEEGVIAYRNASGRALETVENHDQDSTWIEIQAKWGDHIKFRHM